MKAKITQCSIYSNHKNMSFTTLSTQFTAWTTATHKLNTAPLA